MKNIVYIATSLDGYIADKHGGIDWLDEFENPEQEDMGFAKHMASIDALVMGKNTLDVVLSFGGDWPYSKPVFVLSNSMSSVPESLQDKVFIVSGDITHIVNMLHKQGFKNLYIDGGQVIQQFLQAELIDEMVITTIPTLLGDGARLFGSLSQFQRFTLVDSTVYLNALVQNRYRRKNLD